MSFTVETSKWNDETQKFDRFVETRGIGTTLRTWRGTVQVMSDIWEETTFATYWDEASMSLRTDSEVKNVTLDATDEILQKAYEFIYMKRLDYARLDAEEEAKKVRLGSMVEVIGGRKDKGTRGKVVVEIMRPYGMGYRSFMAKKVAIATSDVTVKVTARNGKVYENYRDVVWVWARNIVLTETPEIDLEKVQESARDLADREFKQYVTFA